MRLSQRLDEARCQHSDDHLLDVLSEDVIQSMRVGDFSDEMIAEAFVGIFSSYGLTEDDSDVVFEAIDEFVEASKCDNGGSQGILGRLKSAAKDALKAVGKAALDAAKEGGKEAVKAGAEQIKKKIGAEDDDEEKDDKGEEPKKGIEKKLKGIAGKALDQISKDPSRASDIIKSHGKEAAKELAKHGVKKGMKMVFGRWVKTKESGSKKKQESVQIESADQSLVEAVQWLTSHAEDPIGTGEVLSYQGDVPDWVSEAFEVSPETRSQDSNGHVVYGWFSECQAAILSPVDGGCEFSFHTSVGD